MNDPRSSTPHHGYAFSSPSFDADAPNIGHYAWAIPGQGIFRGYSGEHYPHLYTSVGDAAVACPSTDAYLIRIVQAPDGEIVAGSGFRTPKEAMATCDYLCPVMEPT